MFQAFVANEFHKGREYKKKLSQTGRGEHHLVIQTFQGRGPLGA